MRLSDEDLRDIERGEPWGVNLSDLPGLLLLLTVAIVWIGRHIS